MERRDVEAWVQGYERAWREPGTALLAELFTEDASYRPDPFQEPYLGLESIAEMWEQEREGPDEVFTMASEIVAVEGDTGVVRLEVRYGDPVQEVFLDLWIVRLDERGRCMEFEEWPFSPPE